MKITDRRGGQMLAGTARLRITAIRPAHAVRECEYSRRVGRYLDRPC
jgi:hypothetical protein